MSRSKILTRLFPKRMFESSLTALASAEWLDDRRRDKLVTDVRTAARSLAVAELRAAALDGDVVGEQPGYEIIDGVAHIALTGDIMPSIPWLFRALGMPATSTIEVRAALAAALDDDEAQSIMLTIDSPGGQLAGVKALADEIFQARNQTKAIVAHVTGTAASAAYWIGSQATTFTAEEDAQLGSIGVVTRALKNDADGVIEVYSDNASEKVGEPEQAFRDHMRARANEVAGFFKAAVSRGRGLSPEATANIANGHMWGAAKAEALGLIDGIAKHEDVHEEISTPADPPLAQIQGAESGAETIGESMSTENSPEMAALLQRVAALEAQAKNSDEAKAKAEAKAESLEAETKAKTEALAVITEERKIELIEAGVTAGKITPALREVAENFAKTADVDAVGSFIDSLPQQTRPDPMGQTRPRTGPSSPNTSEEAAVQRAFGLSKKTFDAYGEILEVRGDGTAVTTTGDVISLREEVN